MVENNPFIPETVFVCPSMKKVLTVFCDFAEYPRKIVISAPGVGKLVLSFLGVLRIASTREKDDTTSSFSLLHFLLLLSKLSTN